MKVHIIVSKIILKILKKTNLLDNERNTLTLYTAQIYDRTTTLQQQKCRTLDFATIFRSIQQIVVVFSVSKIFHKSIFQGEFIYGSRCNRVYNKYVVL